MIKSITNFVIPTIIGATIGLAVICVYVLFATGTARANDFYKTNDINRQIGIEMLKDAFQQHQRAIDWTPPGYFMIGYTVRVG